MFILQDITCWIAGKPLFEKVSMDLQRGQHAALIGRNGAGKTTLFRLILGEIEADQGKIQVEKNTSIASVAQEMDVKGHTPLTFVLEAHQEQADLLRQADVEEDPYKIAEIHMRLAELDTYRAPAKAARILVGLGFDEAAQHQPLSSFSGGWQRRVALAAILFREPDLLLLDEPTNHLDLEATVWLENYLKSYSGTFIVISHDRHFINGVVDRVYHLNNRTITSYNGNYDFFEKTRRERMMHDQARLRQQQEQKDHIQKFVDRFRAQPSKSRQVQSRIKMLERFEPIVVEKDMASIHLSFPEPDLLPSPIIMLEKVSVGYDGQPILRQLSQRLAADDRIALLGKNGNGKSTFAKLIAGVLDPLAGTIDRPNKLTVGYFHQHQLEVLNPEKTAFDHLQEIHRQQRPDQVRAHLGRFGLSQEKSDAKVKALSGGEKSRLAFALITAQKPNILILDEPTNHLDMETRESLIMAINAFPGAVILISHDWHLLELTVDRLWLVAGGNVTRFEGDLTEYRKIILGQEVSSKKDKGMKKK